MFYTDARDAHYKAGVPRDLKAFFTKLGGEVCPKCGTKAGFSTLNEYKDWDDVSYHSPFRCAVCQNEWKEA